MSSEQQAKDLITQAQKKLNSWSFFGPSNKCEDAAELYEKAGNMFKLAQQCKYMLLFFFAGLIWASIRECCR